MLRKIIWYIYSFYYNYIKIYPYYDKMLFDVIKNLELKDNYTILDAGCGTGNFEEKILNENISNIKLEGLDSSKSMINKARKKFQNSQNINFKKGDLEFGIPYKNEFFDRIVCINTLHVIKNYKNLINEFYRVLKRGGILIIILPKDKFSFLSFFLSNLKYCIKNNMISVLKMIFVSMVLFPLSIPISFFENKFNLNEFTYYLKKFNIKNIRKTYSNQAYLISAFKN